MFKRSMPVVVLLALAAGVFGADDKATSAEKAMKIIKAASPSLVRVELTMRYDQGEAPRARGWRYKCPNCGNWHYRGGGEYVDEQRPAEVAGFVIAPDRVVVGDPLLHERFIEKIEVVDGEGRIAATVDRYARDYAALTLKLAKPLTGAKPAKFDANREGTLYAVTYEFNEGRWITRADPLSTAVNVTSDDRPFTNASGAALVVDEEGNAVGLAMATSLAADGSWKGDPDKWPGMTAAERAAAIRKIQSIADRALLHVQLSFRSPRKSASDEMSFNYYDDMDGMQSMEKHTTGVLLSPTRMLVLASMTSKTTARLKRIRVYDKAGEAHEAKFAGSLEYYGAIVADLDKPMGEPVKLSAVPLPKLRDRMLFDAEVSHKGEARITHFGHARISSVEVGWRRQLYPEMYADEKPRFLLDDQGELIVLSVAQRTKGEESRWESQHLRMTAAQYLAPVLSDLAAHVDASNVPLSEKDEARLAWLGVQMQPLDRELARMNKVADKTEDGRNGVLVTFVYPDSPAAKAGIEPGAVLLWIRAEGQPRPMPIRMEQDRWSYQAFPWDRYGEVSEQYYDEIPKPWPAAETVFSRTLTDLGFGKKFTLDYAVDGEVKSKPFVVTQGPDHYDMADRFKCDPLGMTVRDLTYEVRRYFQMTDDAPGVIVSKITMGSRASIAGLKPYEIITTVNDKPVKKVADFEKIAGEGGELRLNVLRMNKGRIVKVQMPAAEEDAAAAPDAPEAPADE